MSCNVSMWSSLLTVVRFQEVKVAHCLLLESKQWRMAFPSSECSSKELRCSLNGSWTRSKKSSPSPVLLLYFEIGQNYNMNLPRNRIDYQFWRNWSYISFPFNNSFAFPRPFKTPINGQIPFLKEDIRTYKICHYKMEAEIWIIIQMKERSNKVYQCLNFHHLLVHINYSIT